MGGRLAGKIAPLAPSGVFSASLGKFLTASRIALSLLGWFSCSGGSSDLFLVPNSRGLITYAVIGVGSASLHYEWMKRRCTSLIGVVNLTLLVFVRHDDSIVTHEQVWPRDSSSYIQVTLVKRDLDPLTVTLNEPMT
jgi:hypothetical protein